MTKDSDEECEGVPSHTVLKQVYINPSSFVSHFDPPLSMMMTTVAPYDDYSATSSGHAASMNNTDMSAGRSINPVSVNCSGRNNPSPPEEMMTRMVSSTTSSSNTWQGPRPGYYLGTQDGKTGYHQDATLLDTFPAALEQEAGAATSNGAKQ
eukprot:scaffold30483_cov52-Attheya_sp.AAC.3